MKLKKLLCPVLLAGLFLSFNSSCTFDSQKQTEITIIQIGDFKLSSKDFAIELSKRLKDYDLLSARDDNFVQQAKKSVMQGFIHNYIVKTWANQNSIVISKEELEEAFSKIRAQYPDDISFRESFVSENMSMDDWLEKLRIKLLEQKVQEKLTADVEKPSDKEARAYYKNNKDRFKIKAAIKIRQIVTENQLEGERIRKLVRRGSNFEKLARKFSIAPDAQEGGHAGWIEKGTMDVFDKAFNLRKGATSPIWESPYGQHLIQILDKRSARQLSFREVKDQIVKELFEDRKQATYTSWVSKQVKSLKVLINEEALAAIKVDINIQ